MRSVGWLSRHGKSYNTEETYKHMVKRIPDLIEGTSASLWSGKTPMILPLNLQLIRYL